MPLPSLLTTLPAAFGSTEVQAGVRHCAMDTDLPPFPLTLPARVPPSLPLFVSVSFPFPITVPLSLGPLNARFLFVDTIIYLF